MSNYSEIFAIIEDDHVVFIVVRNNEVVRLVRESISDRISECMCIKCDYRFFIDNIAFDDYYDTDNCENMMRHMLEDVDDQ